MVLFIGSFYLKKHLKRNTTVGALYVLASVVYSSRWPARNSVTFREALLNVLVEQA